MTSKDIHMAVSLPEFLIDHDLGLEKEKKSFCRPRTTLNSHLELRKSEVGTEQFCFTKNPERPWGEVE